MTEDIEPTPTPPPPTPEPDRLSQLETQLLGIRTDVGDLNERLATHIAESLPQEPERTEVVPREEAKPEEEKAPEPAPAAPADKSTGLFF
jgi:hypothetical protein